MNQTAFAVLVLLPSVALCFVILSTFYGAVKAYAAISWIPITLYLLLSAFEQMQDIQSFHTTNFKLLIEAVGWTSLVQSLVGVALIVSASIQKNDWIILAIATLVTLIPYLMMVKI